MKVIDFDEEFDVYGYFEFYSLLNLIYLASFVNNQSSEIHDSCFVEPLRVPFALTLVCFWGSEAVDTLNLSYQF